MQILAIVNGEFIVPPCPNNLQAHTAHSVHFGNVDAAWRSTLSNETLGYPCGLLDGQSMALNKAVLAQHAPRLPVGRNSQSHKENPQWMHIVSHMVQQQAHFQFQLNMGV